MSQSANDPTSKSINSDGGAVIEGGVGVGQDFVGRDQLNIEQLIVVGPAYADLTDLGERVRQNLGILPELVKHPAVRDAAATFRADFVAAGEQVELLGDYKDLHDGLHNLQFTCYNQIVRSMVRFPDDDLVLDLLASYELEMDRLLTGMREVRQRARVAVVTMGWIDTLTESQQALRQALSDRDRKVLERSVNIMRRILSQEPSRICTNLTAVARLLRLAELATAMQTIHAEIRQMEGAAEKAQRFEEGVGALATLDASLSTLVDLHDRWQDVDIELRGAETSLRFDPASLNDLWPIFQEKTSALLAEDEWSERFSDSTRDLDGAIRSGDARQIVRNFSLYQHQAGVRFYRVDTALKALCTEVRKIGDPLNAVLSQLEGDL